MCPLTFIGCFFLSFSRGPLSAPKSRPHSIDIILLAWMVRTTTLCLEFDAPRPPWGPCIRREWQVDLQIPAGTCPSSRSPLPEDDRTASRRRQRPIRPPTAHPAWSRVCLFKRPTRFARGQPAPMERSDPRENGSEIGEWTDIAGRNSVQCLLLQRN